MGKTQLNLWWNARREKLLKAVQEKISKELKENVSEAGAVEEALRYYLKNKS